MTGNVYIFCCAAQMLTRFGSIPPCQLLLLIAVSIILLAVICRMLRRAAIIRKAFDAVGLHDPERLQPILSKHPWVTKSRYPLVGDRETLLKKAAWVSRDDKWGRETQVVEQLLAAGADPNNGDKNGFKPLHWVMNHRIAELLLEHGADPNAATRDNYGGITPLHGLGRNEADIIPLLIKYGANPNASSTAGYTPLHYAAVHGYTDVIQHLLVAGANPSARSTGTGKFSHVRGGGNYYFIDRQVMPAGSTPAMVAEAFRHTEAAAIIRNYESKTHEAADSGNKNAADVTGSGNQVFATLGKSEKRAEKRRLKAEKRRIKQKAVRGANLSMKDAERVVRAVLNEKAPTALGICRWLSPTTRCGNGIRLLDACTDATDEDRFLAKLLRWSGAYWGVQVGGGLDEESAEVEKIGEFLYENGGHERMLRVWHMVDALGGDGRYLEFTWHGIGPWRG